MSNTIEEFTKRMNDEANALLTYLRDKAIKREMDSALGFAALLTAIDKLWRATKQINEELSEQMYIALKQLTYDIMSKR